MGSWQDAREAAPLCRALLARSDFYLAFANRDHHRPPDHQWKAGSVTVVPELQVHHGPTILEQRMTGRTCNPPTMAIVDAERLRQIGPPSLERA